MEDTGGSMDHADREIAIFLLFVVLFLALSWSAGRPAFISSAALVICSILSALYHARMAPD